MAHIAKPARGRAFRPIVAPTCPTGAMLRPDEGAAPDDGLDDAGQGDDL